MFLSDFLPVDNTSPNLKKAVSSLSNPCGKITATPQNNSIACFK